MTASVLSSVLDTAGSQKIGVITLNRPQTLNGLTLEMCHSLTEVLDQWEADASIALVVLRGSGDRAFCAGGDLHGMYQSMLDNASGNAWDNAYTREFFDVEYRLDYQIHTYSKPILCWGSGIVMGGGVGLMMGASHRVVTNTTRFAMPEISIGLFPDVGGTWMLSRLPDGIGNFLALTGAQLGAADCEAYGLADHILDADGYDALLADLQAIDWATERTNNDSTLRKVLQARRPEKVASGPLQQHQSLIRQLCGGRNLANIAAGINSLADHDDSWLQRAAKTFSAGSPGSARLSFTLLQRVRFMSLADVFRQEYIVSLQCGVQGDLQEGIRALLIDKDKSPAWRPATLEQADRDWVERFFIPPWPQGDAHPLADLGTTP